MDGHERVVAARAVMPGSLGRPVSPVAIANAVPGMLALFSKRVPPEHLTELGAVACLCGGETLLDRPWVACRGGCRRWFIDLPSGVWSAGPFPEAPAAEAAA